MAMRRCDADEHHYDDSRYSTCPYCRSTTPYIPPEPTSEPEPTPAPPPGPIPTKIFGIDKEQIPVVGWLVIMSSPTSSGGRDNKGRDLRLIPGMNRIGRSADMEVSVDFGDNKIGRNTHCVVTFDPESNGFFLSSGEGRNLTYVARDPSEDGTEEGGWDVVLKPRQLNHLDRIKLGDTIFIFVPFCSEYFKWDFHD